MDDKMKASFEKVTEAFKLYSQAIAEKAVPAMQSVVQAGNQLEEILHSRYEATGMPYGPSEHGFYLWLEDVAKAERSYQQVRLGRRQPEE